MDYRALNKAIEPDAYTLPTVTENLSELSGDRYFTALDLKEAFWSVPLTPASRELTAFRTPDGLFQYKRMPMGLKTAPAVFCRFIDRVLGPMKWDHVLTYIDDLLVHTPTFEKHIEVLSDLFARLSAANLTLGAKKCFMFRPEVRFLGHVVDAGGMRPDPSKVKAIEALELPNNADELAHALGIMGYYRRFILNYSKVSAPLRAKKDGPAHSWRKDKDGKVPWTEEERAAFFKLRGALQTSPVLQHPDWAHPSSCTPTHRTRAWAPCFVSASRASSTSSRTHRGPSPSSRRHTRSGNSKRSPWSGRRGTPPAGSTPPSGRGR